MQDECKGEEGNFEREFSGTTTKIHEEIPGETEIGKREVVTTPHMQKQCPNIIWIIFSFLSNRRKMSTLDLVNGTFESLSGVMILNHCRVLYRRKRTLLAIWRYKALERIDKSLFNGKQEKSDGKTKPYFYCRIWI